MPCHFQCYGILRKGGNNKDTVPTGLTQGIRYDCRNHDPTCNKCRIRSFQQRPFIPLTKHLNKYQTDAVTRVDTTAFG